MSDATGRELHELLRELVERQGAGVIETPEAFRAALDDFLTEDEATLGQLNLLGDAVRLGAVDRLLSMLDHGADPNAAVAEAGDTLARDRGTEDQRRTRWAVAAVGYALGRITEPVVAAYSTGAPVSAQPPTVEPPSTPPPPPPAPPPETAASPGPGPGTLSGRSVDADTWDQQRQPPTYPPVPPEPRRRRAWPVLLAVLVLMLAGGGVLAWVLTQDDETPSNTATDEPTDNPTDDPSESASNGPIDVPSNTILLPIKRDDSSQIYAVDPDNPDTLAPITPGDSDNFPAISPDRETIVYLARATDNAVWPIVLDVATGESHQLFDSEDACDYARRPAFSPDGQRLALNCIDANGESVGMYIVDPEGGLEQAIDIEGVVRGTPTWVSQTQLVAAVADSEDGPSTLWLYDIQSEVPQQLTSGEGWDTHPDWVAGPDRLLFVRSESEEPIGELWTLTLDGEAEQIDVGQPVHDPVWSPGGTEIAFRTEDDMLATLVVDDPESVEVVPGTENVNGPPVWGDR